MKKFFLLAAVSTTQVQNLQLQSTSTLERSSGYSGESYRAPYLEKVVKTLNSKVRELVSDENEVPKEMDHLLCMFETK